MFKTAVKNTIFPSDYVDSLIPDMVFSQFILNSNEKLNFLATYNGDVIGFFTVHINMKRKFGYIGFISVLKKYRGSGFSYDLLRKAESELSKLSTSKWLESTDSLNKPMLRSFKKYGFKEIKHLYGYVYKPEIAFKKFL